MLQLTINGLPAVIKKGTSFKLTRENPALSEQGDYTFEVTLPLRGCPGNRAIYGHAHRIESPLPDILKELPFRLASPLVTLTGTARATSLTQDEIKVQLVAGRSEANLKTTDDDGNDIYIDEMDLGKIFDEYDIPALTDGECRNITNMKTLADYLIWKGPSTGTASEHGGYGETSATFFPVVDASNTETDGEGYSYSPYYRNNHTYQAKYDYATGETAGDGYQDGEWRVDYDMLSVGMRSFTDSGEDSYKYNISPQPRLWECMRRVLRAAGYTLAESDDSFMRNLIVITTARSVDYKDLLPHWTLSQFIKEFNNFFATVIVFHDDKTAEVRPRADFYGDDFETVTETAGTLTTEFPDESAASYSSSGNVDYDWPDDDDMLRLPDEVWENATAKYLEDGSAVREAYAALTTEQKKKSDFLLIDTVLGNTYASLQNVSTEEWQLTTVDIYPPLLRDTTTRDISTSLKIVPARMTNNCPVLALSDGHPTLLASTMEQPGEYSVNSAINSDSPAASSDSTSTTKEKKDYIEVAYAPGTITAAHLKATTKTDGSYQYFPIAAGVMVQHNANSNLLETFHYKDTATPQCPVYGPFRLTDTSTAFMRVNAIDESELANTRIERQIQFIAHRPLDVTKPFLIRSRPYICAKLEYTITPDRVSPLVTGYFHPLL